MVAHTNTFEPDCSDSSQLEQNFITTPNHSLFTDSQPVNVCIENRFHWQNIDSLRLLVQIGLTFIIVGLCIGKLTVDKQDKALYWGGIMSIVAWWMPSPGASKSLSGAGK